MSVFQEVVKNVMSQRQLEANQENAKKGGVKTKKGKMVSKYNAIKHGILAGDVLLETESKKAFMDFSEKIKKDLNPVNGIELLFVERIITNTWRLKRVLRAEKHLTERDRADLDFCDLNDPHFTNYIHYGKFTRYEITLERGIYRA